MCCIQSIGLTILSLANADTVCLDGEAGLLLTAAQGSKPGTLGRRFEWLGDLRQKECFVWMSTAGLPVWCRQSRGAEPAGLWNTPRWRVSKRSVSILVLWRTIIPYRERNGQNGSIGKVALLVPNHLAGDLLANLYPAVNFKQHWCRVANKATTLDTMVVTDILCFTHM